jgi:thioredoxin-dependent peroxiredoxin
MIDPPKATKGRRMSKKTRKKSPKAAPKKAARAQSKTSAKTPASKTRLVTANKSGKNVSKQPRKTVAGASHKAASKTLKSPGRGASAVRIAAAISKPAVATAAAKNPPAKSPSDGKADPSAAARKSALIEGAKAPGFRLPRDGGDTVSLADYSGKKLVLFFYPRADTPGCTKEAIDFTRLASAFADSQTAVLGVSADPPKAQEAFRDKHELTTPLVSDEQHEMLEAYGVWGEKSMYGRTFQGILRTTVLIGADGRIIRIWRNVKVDGHADEVLAAARAL